MRLDNKKRLKFSINLHDLQNNLVVAVSILSADDYIRSIKYHKNLLFSLKEHKNVWHKT